MGQQPYIVWAFWSCVLMALVFVSFLTYLARRNNKEAEMELQQDPPLPEDTYADLERRVELVSAYYRLLNREGLPTDLIYRLIDNYAFQLTFAK